MVIIRGTRRMQPEFEPVIRLTGAVEVHCEPGRAPLGEGAEVVVAGTKIIEISADASTRSTLTGPSVSVLDVSGLIIVPGFVDIHMHLAGGGGEAGFRSRTPEAQLSEIVEAGITTCVGVLGTDAVARAPLALLAKVKALREEGLSAYMWTGAYAVPPPTLTGCARRDVMAVEEVIGVGEVAISDHRSSAPTTDELRRIASDARVAGLLSGKAGVMYCHMGSGPAGLAPLWDVVAPGRSSASDIPITNVIPTHMSRSPQLIEEGKEWLRAGGYVDFTSGEPATEQALLGYWNEGIPATARMLCSSDAYGSQPEFDAQGRVVGYSVAPPSASLALLRRLHYGGGEALRYALAPFTANPADAARLRGKGRLRVGGDADLLALDPADGLALRYVMSGGRVLKTPDWTATGIGGAEKASRACTQAVDAAAAAAAAAARCCCCTATGHVQTCPPGRWDAKLKAQLAGASALRQHARKPQRSIRLSPAVHSTNAPAAPERATRRARLPLRGTRRPWTQRTPQPNPRQARSAAARAVLPTMTERAGRTAKVPGARSSSAARRRRAQAGIVCSTSVLSGGAIPRALHVLPVLRAASGVRMLCSLTGKRAMCLAAAQEAPAVSVTDAIVPTSAISTTSSPSACALIWNTMLMISVGVVHRCSHR
ncbi:hypothetical protein JKP88DRAFT_267875 [Tribonema minus]|uniref:Amidohydrolase-related domain-containing protein n=1 Tax=Tribonema minus TaxID=303371 RepID=A0A835Z9U2_9STRA|nr:hypothetical protein JKP88DRAFT_267875 [Tribonema minus]